MHRLVIRKDYPRTLPWQLKEKPRKTGKRIQVVITFPSAPKKLRHTMNMENGIFKEALCMVVRAASAVEYHDMRILYGSWAMI